MAVFKCKMCGAPINIEGYETVITCEYCDSSQTLPKFGNEKREQMYDRANHFRRSNEFDKAAAIYEQILLEDGTDAEDYWSLVLCKYGVEYVEDPMTSKRVPTVNRAQFTSIYDDENYKGAIEHADVRQRGIYEEEARAINEIQKGILAISQKEEPFDVFICYKETGADGRRTPDSVLATELYQQLTREGFKVFFSRITLESKLGTAYEPYIFAALNSAKVMVVIGTKPEYFNAVWVKNEWSRFLSLIKGGAEKLLIPAYRDMDPYDLPDEFSHLQAQDMSKLGFMQDLTYGITKIVRPRTEQPVVNTVEVPSAGAGNTVAFLKRAFIFLEDKDWSSANEYSEKVLDIDPENGEAYLAKLMAELKVSNRRALSSYRTTFDNNANYIKAVRYGSPELKNELERYNREIVEKNTESMYQDACTLMQNAANEGDYKKAANLFRNIPSFRDSEYLSQQCLEKAEICRKDGIYDDAVQQMNLNTVSSLDFAIAKFKSIPGWKDADYQVQLSQNAKNDVVYNLAIKEKEKDTIASLESAWDGFESIISWRDAELKLSECKARLKELRNIEENKKRALKEKAENEKNERLYSSTMNKKTYASNEAEYNDCINAFYSIRNYKDSRQQISECYKIVRQRYADKVISLEETLSASKKPRILQIIIIAIFALFIVASATGILESVPAVGVVLMLAFFVMCIIFIVSIYKYISARLDLDSKGAFVKFILLVLCYMFFPITFLFGSSIIAKQRKTTERELADARFQLEKRDADIQRMLNE